MTYPLSRAAKILRLSAEVRRNEGKGDGPAIGIPLTTAQPAAVARAPDKRRIKRKLDSDFHYGTASTAAGRGITSSAVHCFSEQVSSQAKVRSWLGANERIQLKAQASVSEKNKGNFCLIRLQLF